MVLSDISRQNLPELYKEKENCCGCTACYAICPAEAITMKPDEEGFLYPYVHGEKCIRCYECMKVCIFKRNQREKEME